MHFMHSKYEVFSSEVHIWKSDNIRKHLQSFLGLFSATYALPWRFFPPFSDFTDQRREQLHQRRSGGEGGGGGGGALVLLGCGQTPGCTYSLRGGGMEGSVDAVWTDVLQVAPPPDGSR